MTYVYWHLMWSADNLCKQFEPNWSPRKRAGLVWVWIVWPPEGIPESDFKKAAFRKKKPYNSKLPGMQRVSIIALPDAPTLKFIWWVNVIDNSVIPQQVKSTPLQTLYNLIQISPHVLVDLFCKLFDNNVSDIDTRLIRKHHCLLP